MKKNEVRYIVTSVVSIPVYKMYGKTEAYKLAAKDGWGTVYRDENNELVCDEDCSANLYTKNGGYFGIYPYDEINTKELPKQAACAAIITSDSCGYSFWAEDFSRIHIFVTYDENGLIDNYRIEYDEEAYEGEVEIAFEDLYQQAEDDWQETCRASIPGTVEYDHKREADKLAEESGETWMNDNQREQFRRVCSRIDRIRSAFDFFEAMQSFAFERDFDEKITIAARRFKKCFNFSQYEQPKEVARRADLLEFYERYTLEDTTAAGAAAEAASAEGIQPESIEYVRDAVQAYANAEDPEAVYNERRSEAAGIMNDSEFDILWDATIFDMVLHPC